MAVPSIIEKIKKILAKTIENGCTPEEAATAAAMASKLMEQHQIDMADLVEKGEVVRQPIDLEIFYESKRVDSWIAALANVLCAPFSCVVVISMNRGLGVYGRPDNREAFKATFEWLKNAIHKGGKNTCPSNVHGRTWTQSYGLGADAAINARVKEERLALTQQAAAGNKNAIMLLDEEGLVKKHANIDNLKPRTTAPQINADGYRQGYNDGQKMNLGSVPGRTQFTGAMLTA